MNKNNNKIKYYKKYFLAPPLVRYSDGEKPEMLKLTKETIDNNYKDIIGKPVIISHDGNFQVGIVVDAYYDTDKNAYICGFNIWDENAKDLLDNKEYSVSCTYNIIKSTNGGLFHNIPYDREIKEFGLKNLALVEEPRFEEARDYINSLNTGEIMEKEKKFSFFKKKEPEKVNNEKCNSSDDFIVYKGQKISLDEFAKTLLDEAVYHKDKPVNDESEKENTNTDSVSNEEEVKEEEVVEKEPVKENNNDSIDELESFLIEKGLNEEDLSKVCDLIIKLYETINKNDDVENEVKDSENVEEVKEEVKDEEPKKEEEKKVEELKLNSLNPKEYSSFEKSFYKGYKMKNSLKTTDEIIDESTKNF